LTVGNEREEVEPMHPRTYLALLTTVFSFVVGPGCGSKSASVATVAERAASNQSIKEGFDAAFEKVLRDYPATPQEKFSPEESLHPAAKSK
jgi:hypothetical protein